MEDEASRALRNAVVDERFEDAVSIADSLLKQLTTTTDGKAPSAEETECWRWKIVAELEQNKISEARKSIGSVLRRYPSLESSIAFLRAYACYRSGDLHSVLPLTRKFTERGGLRWALLHAQTCFRLGYIEEAYQYFLSCFSSLDSAGDEQSKEDAELLLLNLLACKAGAAALNGGGICIPPGLCQRNPELLRVESDVNSRIAEQLRAKQNSDISFNRASLDFALGQFESSKKNLNAALQHAETDSRKKLILLQKLILRHAAFASKISKEEDQTIKQKLIDEYNTFFEEEPDNVNRFVISSNLSALGKGPVQFCGGVPKTFGGGKPEFPLPGVPVKLVATQARSVLLNSVVGLLRDPRSGADLQKLISAWKRKTPSTNPLVGELETLVKLKGVINSKTKTVGDASPNSDLVTAVQSLLRRPSLHNLLLAVSICLFSLSYQPGEPSPSNDAAAAAAAGAHNKPAAAAKPSAAPANAATPAGAPTSPHTDAPATSVTPINPRSRIAQLLRRALNMIDWDDVCSLAWSSDDILRLLSLSEVVDCPSTRSESPQWAKDILRPRQQQVGSNAPSVSTRLAAGLAFLRVSPCEPSASGREFFEQLARDGTSSEDADLISAVSEAGLLACSSDWSEDDVESLRKKAHSIEATSVDVESAACVVVTPTKDDLRGWDILKLVAPDLAPVDKRVKKRTKKKRYPKGVDPATAAVEGPPASLDPERWLPMAQRTYYRGAQKKHYNKQAQGLVVGGDEAATCADTSKTATTATISVSGPSTNARHRGRRKQ